MYKIIGADGREYGPINLEELRQWHTQGRVNAQTRVLVTGETNWKTIADLSEFSAPTPEPIRPPTATRSVSSFGQRTNGFAVAGFVSGILSLFSCCCCALLPFHLLGLTFSIIALVQISNRPETYSGKGLAIAGLIISGLSLLFGIGSLVFNWQGIVSEFQHV